MGDILGEKVMILTRESVKIDVKQYIALDVCKACKAVPFDIEGRKAKVIGGRYGLASRDTQPKHIKSVYDFMKSPKAHTELSSSI